MTGRLHLEILGGIRLGNGVGVAPRPPQPKRLALLVHLLLTTPRPVRTRDELMAFFWPEADHRRGRTSVRKALHALRRILGPDAIPCDGQRVSVDPLRVGCDAVEFRKALEAGRPAEALELYRGDLLRGFHLAGVPSFQRWLDLERQRLRRSAVAAALALSRQAEREGDPEAATNWACRAVTLDPFDEATVRHAAELLCDVGRRADAFRTLRLLVRRLDEEWEMAPSPETTALIEAIRTGALRTRRPL